jgi:cell wall-associated NlpC family hydrolase
LKNYKSFEQYIILPLAFVFTVTAVSVQAQVLPPADVPLRPDNGGKSIPISALKRGDIIVSTTSHPISVAIRAVTNSAVSHAMLYAGSGNVIEAVQMGVAPNRLDEVLRDAKIAVVYRSPKVTSSVADTLVNHAERQIGKKYSIAGIVRHPRLKLLSADCNALSGVSKAACAGWQGLVKSGVNITIGRNVFQNEDEFFCSQLVIESYRQAGIDLFGVTPETTTPGQISVLNLVGELQYVGHLKFEP